MGVARVVVGTGAVVGVARVVVADGAVVVVGMRLWVMARTAAAASTVPLEPTRFWSLLSKREVSMRISRIALGVRFGSMDRMRATRPVTCGAAIAGPTC